MDGGWGCPYHGGVAVTEDERRLRAELPELLDLLGHVSAFVGGLDLAKLGDVPDATLEELRDGLLRALEYLHGLFAFRGEPPPAPEAGISFRALGPSLKRTLPQRLAAELEDELNAVPGERLEDLGQFAALGLFARITDLLRFVGWLAEEKAAAARRAAPPTVASARHARPRAAKAEAGGAVRPAAAPAPGGPREAPQPVTPATPAPTGPGPDLSSYDIRIDEAGERIDAGPATVWFATAADGEATGGGLAASFAVPLPGGAALAVAEGLEPSLGSRLAAVVAVRTFCRAVPAASALPEGALRTVQAHLDALLGALLTAGDASAALARVSGGVPPPNARRILAHTRRPEEALRRVPPALATGLVGAVAVEGSGGLRVTVVRLGGLPAELRTAGRVVPLFGGPGAGPPAFLAPGERGVAELARVEAGAPVTLRRGEALLLGTPALAKGSPSAWEGLASLLPSLPDGLGPGDSARELLRRAERWGAAEPGHFGGPLGFALLLAR